MHATNAELDMREERSGDTTFGLTLQCRPTPLDSRIDRLDMVSNSHYI
jgi:hypothetical protein